MATKSTRFDTTVQADSDSRALRPSTSRQKKTTQKRVVSAYTHKYQDIPPFIPNVQSSLETHALIKDNRIIAK